MTDTAILSFEPSIHSERGTVLTVTLHDVDRVTALVHVVPGQQTEVIDCHASPIDWDRARRVGGKVYAIACMARELARK